MSEQCRGFRQRLDAYVDGELDPADARVLEDHLAGCPACREVLAKRRGLDHALREGLLEEPIEPRFEERSLERVLKRIDQEPSPAWEPSRSAARPSPRFRWRWNLRWIAGAAVATAAVLLALRLGSFPLAPQKPPKVQVQTEPTLSGAEPKKAGTRSEVGGIAKTLPEGEPRDRGTPAQEIVQREDERQIEVDESGGAVEPEPSAPTFAPAREHLAEETTAPPEPGALFAEDTEEDEPTLRIRATPRPPAEEPVSVDEPVSAEDQDAAEEPVSLAELEVGEKKRSLPIESKAKVGKLMRSVTEPPERTSIHFDSAEPGESIDPAETLDASPDLRQRLVLAERRLRQRIPPMRRETEELALQWRTIGDLWEWIGRQEADREAFARAVEAYRLAAEIDRSAADLDSIRVQRARSRAGNESDGNRSPR
jgi:hypothetical protein